SHLQSLSEGRSRFELPRYVKRNNLCIDFGLLNFLDLQLNLLVDLFLKVIANLFDCRTLAADYDPRPRCVTYYSDSLRVTDNLNFRAVGVRRFRQFGNELSELEILVESGAIFARIHVPLGLPGPVDTKPDSDWIYFLPHLMPPPA